MYVHAYNLVCTINPFPPPPTHKQTTIHKQCWLLHGFSLSRGAPTHRHVYLFVWYSCFLTHLYWLKCGRATRLPDREEPAKHPDILKQLKANSVFIPSPRWSHYWGGPNTEVVPLLRWSPIPRWSHYWGPITEVVLLLRSHYWGGPITKVVPLLRWSHYQGGPIAEVVPLLRYVAPWFYILLRWFQVGYVY